MVVGYTANEYGDYLIASLKEPYLNVSKVLDWEIVAGVQGPRTAGTVNVTNGSPIITGNNTDFTMLSEGEQIILGNSTYEISTIDSELQLTLTENADFTTTELEFYLAPTQSSYFEYEYRWSDTNAQFSEFRPLTKNMAFGDLLTLNFDSTKPLWLDIKAEVAALSAGNSLTFIAWNFTLQLEDGQIESCPQFCVECTDPFAYDGCANIEVSCEDNTFQPYRVHKTSTVYKQLVNITNTIFGHDVQYFRTEPDKRTEDVILMEYSLFNVVDKKTIKILVPDNEFPEENPTYDIFGMEFAEFEVHITAEEFESHFGAGKTPRNLDYMYIPIINRMYEVSSVGLADEFNKEHSYYRVKLVKYQERTSVQKNAFEADTDSLITGVEEVFGERQAEEMEKDTNPQQFQTVSTSYRDGIRMFVERKLKIEDYDLKNRWTVVSKNYYDLNQMKDNAVAVEYDVKSKLSSDNNMAITMWFSPKFTANDTNEYILFGDLAALNGFKLLISNTELIVKANTYEYRFTHGITFDSEKWYAMILNVNNKFYQLATSIYSLDESNNRGTISPNRPQDASNNLVEEFTEDKDIGQPLVWDASSNFHIRGNKTWMTNIRVFEKVVEYEQHHNVLNQYVVRDNQLSILIDNAIPSLGYQRFKNAR
jgi:hypothetical protein